MSYHLTTLALICIFGMEENTHFKCDRQAINCAVSEKLCSTFVWIVGSRHSVNYFNCAMPFVGEAELVVVYVFTETV